MSSSVKRWIGFLIIILLLVIILKVVLVNEQNEQIMEARVQEKVKAEVINNEKYTKELRDGTKVNTGVEFNNTKTYGNLEISNIQCTEKNEMTVLLADVTNKGNSTHENEVVEITILGENGEELSTTKPIIGRIEPGETVKINASITADVSNAKNFTIKAVR